MAYNKQTWVDLETPLDAEHMNHIEDGIEAASAAADTNATAIAENAAAISNISEEIDEVKPTRYTLDTSHFVPLDIDDFSGYKQPYHPKVLYFADGFAGYKYWMVQTPVPIGGQPYVDRWENPCVYRSNNGIQWGNAENANPLDGLTASEIARTDYMSDPHLVWREDLKRLECWYRHTNRGSEELPTAILRKYTYDGVNWSEREVMIDYKSSHSTDFHRSPAYIWDNDDGYYRAWYAPDGGVKYNTSVDGKTWGTQVDCVYTGGNSNTWHLDVEYIDGYYYLLSYDMNAKNVKCYRSTDCINFEFIKTILTPHDEITDYYRSCSVKDEYGKIRVYFSVSSNNEHKLGVMVGEDFEHLEICDGTKVVYASGDSPAAIDARHVFFDGVSLYDKLREMLGLTENDEPSDPLTGEIPVLAAGPAWYNTELSGAEQETITSVSFVADYDPDGTEDASWACDYENAGKIMAYRKGTDVVVASKTGSDKIQLNLDSAYMFACDTNAYFKNIASITGTEMWVAEAATSMSNVLLGNRVITEPITIPVGVNNLSYGFRNCTALITPPVLPDGLVNINNTFSGCASMSYLPELPSTINGMEGAFTGCTAATSALCVIPANIKYLSATFKNCVKLTGTIEINATSLDGYKDCFLQVGRDSDGVVLTGSCPQLAELAATAGENGNVTVATA